MEINELFNLIDETVEENLKDKNISKTYNPFIIRCGIVCENRACATDMLYEIFNMCLRSDDIHVDYINKRNGIILFNYGAYTINLNVFDKKYFDYSRGFRFDFNIIDCELDNIQFCNIRGRSKNTYNLFQTK